MRAARTRRLRRLPRLPRLRRLRRIAAIAVALTVVGACGSSSQVVAGEVRAHVPRAPASADDARQAARSVDQFGLDLLRDQLGTARGNVAMSPWSVAVALSMVLAGAGGATATEMERVLHVTDPVQAGRAMNGLNRQLDSRNGTFPGSSGEPLMVDVAAANRAFAERTTRFEQPYLDGLARDFGAGVGLADFKTAPEVARRAINGWVGAQTRGRIPELLARGTLDAFTRLVLVNAVYLKADWMTPFAKEQTAEATFHAPSGAVQASFMHGTATRRFASGDGWKAVELQYAGGTLAMTVLVPDEGRYDTVAGQLSPAVFDTLDRADPVQVDLRLPKFQVAHASSLKAQLARLGMPTAFSDQADFTAMTAEEPLRISDVIHQANVTVDEKGTVAAAATAAIVGTTAVPARIERLVVDRPFMFFLRDLPTGALLFAGQVTNPTSRN